MLFAAEIAMDILTSAFAAVTFVAFISMLVDRTCTTTQYALLASLRAAPDAEQRRPVPCREGSAATSGS